MLQYNEAAGCAENHRARGNFICTVPVKASCNQHDSARSNHLPCLHATHVPEDCKPAYAGISRLWAGITTVPACQCRSIPVQVKG